MYQFLAYCRETNANFSMSYELKSKQEADLAFDDFEKIVPFSKWYYEIISEKNIYIDIDDLNFF